MDRRVFRYPFPLRFLYPAVVLSGFTALVYEIVWARRLALFLGSTTSAAAATLSAFMFGLAAGALLVGWRADASKRPLRWYGLLELGVGIYALLFDSLLGVFGKLFASHPWVCSFAILSLPAALMGGTLPVLARAAADTTQRGARAFGGLYGWNTLGAVLGALLGGLVFLESLGMRGTTILAASLNIALGVGFWAIAWAAGDRELYAASEESSPPRRLLGDAEPKIAIAFFLAGFAALGLEMAWFRLLTYYLEGFTIAFALMLAAYLLGLGAGAVGGSWAAVLAKNPRKLLAHVLLGEAVLAVATFLLVTPLGDGLESMRDGYKLLDSIDTTYKMRLFWTALAVVFPATFCAGVLMPVVARIALSDRETIGLHTGAVYAASTLGAVLAPPIAAFWLLPAFGAPKTIAALAALLLVAGTLVTAGQRLREWAHAGGATVAFVALCLAAGLGTPLVERSHVFRRGKPHRLLHTANGEAGDVAVVEDVASGNRRLYLDGFSAAETSTPYGYMRMQGHLPVLLHPAPEKVLVIAFGTGTTAGAVAVHPEVKQIVCVEIEPEVYAAAPFFEAQNRKVLSDPRVTREVADGREFVGRGGKFDVITLEPLMPYTPAAVHFYTKEFYEQAKASLNPEGILCQWIPPQGVSGEDFRRLVASAAAAFDHVSLWYFQHAVLVLGSRQAPRATAQQLVERVAAPQERVERLREDFRIAAAGDLAHVLGAHVVSGDALRAALGDAKPMTDDRPDLEFRPLARGLGRKSVRCHAEVLEFLRDHHQDDIPWLDEALSTDDPAIADLKRGVTTAVKTGGLVLDTLAREQRYRVEPEGHQLPAATSLDAVVAGDKNALFARTIRGRRLYAELVQSLHFAEAAQVADAGDRSKAYLALALRAEGDQQRRYYLTLALSQNALLDPGERRQSAQLLDELATGLEGPEKRFCENRARFLRDQPWEAGEERMPKVEVPDIVAALETGDEAQVRAVFELARQADLSEEVDRTAWNWYEAQEDKRSAFPLLLAFESQFSLRAAGALLKSAGREDLVAVAPFYCARFPASRIWAERLCDNPDAQVREAAADAAKAAGSRAHLPKLLDLCRDPEQGVRTSAFISFREIERGADQTGYDPLAPTEAALKALQELAK